MMQTNPKIKIAPSILASDFARMGQTAEDLEAWGADLVHCDVMDGNFVPPITFGHQAVGAIRPHTKLPLDCHLMTLHPETHIEEFQKAGADGMTVHVEACGKETENVLKKIKAAGMHCGAVLNPDTPIERVFPYVELSDMILVMSVFPGWGGQKFIPESLQRLEALRNYCIKIGRPDFDIEVDGGVSEKNIKEVIAAGANVIVAGSAVFRSPSPKETIARLRGEL